MRRNNFKHILPFVLLVMVKVSDKYRVYLVSAENFIKSGLKPNPGAVLDMLDALKAVEYYSKRVSGPVRIGCFGDTLRDLWLGYNLSKTLKKRYSRQKVRVDNNLINRYGNSHPAADHTVSDLAEMYGLSENEGYHIVLSDGDGTLWKSPIEPSVEVKRKSKMVRFGSHWSVQISYLFFDGMDVLADVIGITRRKLFKSENDSLNDLIKGFSVNNTTFVVHTLCNRFAARRMLNKVSYPISLMPSRVL